MTFILQSFINFFEMNDLKTEFLRKILSDLKYHFINTEKATLAVKSYLCALEQHNIILKEDYQIMMEQLNRYNSSRLSITITENEEELINLEN